MGWDVDVLSVGGGMRGVERMIGGFGEFWEVFDWVGGGWGLQCFAAYIYPLLDIRWSSARI